MSWLAENYIGLLYLIAAILFIFGLKRLGRVRTARSGWFFSSSARPVRPRIPKGQKLKGAKLRVMIAPLISAKTIASGLCKRWKKIAMVEGFM